MNPTHTSGELPEGFRPRRAKGSTRSQFLKWLRRVHGWVGLWGAILGLLFGVTGFLQNHRGVMKIDTGAPVRSSIELEVPDPKPQDARAFGGWIAKSLQLGDIHPRVQREPAQKVNWGGQDVMQPERWEMRFATPQYNVTASYWKGANTVKVTRSDNGWIAVMENLHKSTGVGVGWILLADSIAGSMLLLSITGVILWTELNRRKVLGASIFTASIIAMIVLAGQSL